MSRPGWWTVARWELTRTLRRADFIVSVLLTPALIVGVTMINGALEKRSDERKDRVALVSADARLRPREAKGVTWQDVTPKQAGHDSLARAVRARTLDAALIVPADFTDGGTARLLVRRESPRLKRNLEGFLRDEARQLRASGYGIDTAGLARLDRDIALTVEVTDPTARSSRADRIVALGLMLVLLSVIFIAGSYAMIGISAEKQARVTEVVVSAISPQAWIDGKIVAYTLLGFLNASVWVLGGLWTLLAASSMQPQSITPSTLALCALFGVLGFALYVAMFAALMATLKDFQSASKLQGNLLILPMVPILFLKAILDSPEAGWAIGISLVPFFSPMLMPMRIALGQAPMWQIATGLILLVAAVWWMRGVAGAAFRIGMLMYGKDLSLPELMRMAKR